MTQYYYVRAEGDCNITDTVRVEVRVLVESIEPDAIEVLNDSTCEGTSKDLTLVGGILGGGADWYWYSDDAFTVFEGNGMTIQVDPAVTTTYYVRAEGGCNNTDAVSAEVTVLSSSTDPTGIDITGDNTCQGIEKTLLVSGGSLGEGADWFWYLDSDLTISAGTGASIMVDPDSSMTYYVRAEGTCNVTDTASQLVLVKRISIAPTEASADVSEFCEGDVENIILTYSGGILGDGAEAFWYSDPLFTAPSIASGNNVTIPAPTDTTVYYVRFEGDCNTTEAVNVQVIVNPAPGPVISGEMVVCEPAEAEYTVTGLAGSIFSWSVTGGSITGDAEGETVTVSWTGEGTGTISVTETSLGGCTDSTAFTVVKNVAPIAGEIQGGSDVICTGTTGVAYYIEGLPGSTFTWNVEEGTISQEFGDSILVDWDVAPGEYEISVIETSANGCSGDTLRKVVQVEGPDIDLDDDPYVCEGDLYTIDLGSQFATYLWHDGSTGSSFTTGEAGLISVEVGDEYGCTGVDSVYLTVNPLPFVDLGTDTSLCGDEGLVIDAGSDGTVYTWSTGDMGQEIIVYQGDRQEISVIVEDEYGCISTDTILVDECNAEFFFRDIPTAITPNNDGTNDTWNIAKLAGYSRAEVEVFNRWGILVWKSEPGYSVPWDGTDMNGNPVSWTHIIL